MKSRPTICLVTPALAKANNGNAHTAMRWTTFLQQKYHVKVALSWDQYDCDVMIALHARRSASSIEQYRKTCRPIALVLTGTDLYEDIKTDFSAQRSLEAAQFLVTLQDKGPLELPHELRTKTRTIYQSASVKGRLKARRKTFDIVFVGHLREVKDPLTAIKACLHVQLPHLRLRVIGQSLDERLGHSIKELIQNDQRIVMCGPLPHTRALSEIRKAKLLVCSSLMEGGANVIIEAVQSGTPVLASDILGNRGMLGDDYAGYFPVGDSMALATLIERCHSNPSFYAKLSQQCSQRSELFLPQTEQAQVLQLAQDLLESAVHR
jgi:putative glycosyltransferase (TIGR04348 family)